MAIETITFFIGGKSEKVQAVRNADGSLRVLQDLASDPTRQLGAASLIGQRLVQQLRETAAVNNVLTFAAPLTAIEIYHEASSWQTFAVNGLTITVPPGGYRTAIGGTPGATVGIPVGVACIVGRLE